MAKRKEDTREKCSKQQESLRRAIQKALEEGKAARGKKRKAPQAAEDAYQSMQPCWNCQNFAGGCSWSRRFEPVEGWRAIEVIKEAKPHAPGYTSYKILYCPEFVHD